MNLIYFLIFGFSFLILFFSGEVAINSFKKIAKFLGLKEFVVAFFLLAFAASLPNLLVGLSSAFNNISELCFGDVTGNNLVALTLTMGLAAIISRGGLSTSSRTVETSSFFTMLAAILPLVLVLDNKLSRLDGLLLILFFCFYVYWLFSKKERFTKSFNGEEKIKLANFLIDLLKAIFALILLIVAAQGVIFSAKYFADFFNISLVLVGILITGFFGSLADIFFIVSSTRKSQDYFILGDLMGGVIIPSTLILGIVSIISPIEISGILTLVVARIFLFLAAFFFFFLLKTHSRISKFEGTFLIFLYIIFIISEILVK